MLVLILGLACGLGSPEGIQFHDVTASSAFVKASNPLILDVRTPGEFAGGHLNGAINIDFKSSSFAERLKTLDHTKPVLVHCQSGVRSRMALSYVKEAGFTDIHHMDGGYGAWVGSGLPSTK